MLVVILAQARFNPIVVQTEHEEPEEIEYYGEGCLNPAKDALLLLLLLAILIWLELAGIQCVDWLLMLVLLLID